ncbi:hypothetical protein ACIPVK_11985 [Paeniglutamicibacter sp. MACA_103]|uniref:hypothetical protein n=1 Tax=Paeniglutamicibacter sp. MACA_103 TaxID=3377337 RepID=UPI00389533F2
MPTDAHQRVLALGSRRADHHHGRHRGPRRWGRTLLALVLALGLIGGGLYAAVNFIGIDATVVRQKCTALVGSTLHTLSPDQTSNAAVIAAVAGKRGMPTRAATIGIATSMQESKLTNIDYGDNAGPDSRGLFQQRPSMGWGTEAQVQDPVYAANRFFQELETFDYQSMALTDAAQKVQRSAYPGAYAQHEEKASAFASALTGASPSTLNCTLRPAEAAGSAEVVAADLLEATGKDAKGISGNRVRIPVRGQQGWAIAQWAVANAQKHNTESVSYAGLVWNRSEGRWVPAATTDGYVIISLAGSPQ